MSFASTAGPKPMRRPTTTKIAVQTSSQRRFSDQRKGRPASRWVGSWGAVLKAPAVGGVPSSDAVRASTRAPFRRQTCSSADGQFAPSHARSNFLSQHIVPAGVKEASLCLASDAATTVAKESEMPQASRNGFLRLSP
jgi:hypothetical protein